MLIIAVTYPPSLRHSVFNSHFDLISAAASGRKFRVASILPLAPSPPLDKSTLGLEDPSSDARIEELRTDEVLLVRRLRLVSSGSSGLRPLARA